jgi:hypothetical protein
MSDNHFPNEHPHDDDLQLEHGADASISDADALDTLLNEIAQEDGSPNTRSGHGHERPDVRIEDNGHVSDAGTLHAATRSFHHRFAAAQAGDPGAAALDPHLWETIMTSTTPNAPSPHPFVTAAASVSPAASVIPTKEESCSTRTARRKVPRMLGMTGKSRGPFTRPWQGLANATLALVIILAGFGIWRFYDGLNSTGTPEPTPTVPGLAMQPATPEATETVTAPVATPTPAYACDFTSDIPIFPKVDTSPIDGTALLVTTTGDLVLTCPEEPEPIVLTSGVTQVSPLHWPGIVSTLGEGAPGAQPMTVVNVMSGGMVDVGIPPESMTAPWTQPTDTPWLVAPAAGNPGEWTITDLRNMNSRLYSDLAGAPVPEGTVLAASASGDTLVVVPWIPASEVDPGAIPQGKGMLPTALVVNGSLDATHTIALPADLPPIIDLRLAPDGLHMALITNENRNLPGAVTHVSVVRTSDGKEVGRDNITNTGMPGMAMTWVQGSEALTYLNGASLMLLTTDGDGTPVTLLHDSSIEMLRSTYNPDVVTVSGHRATGGATETPGESLFLTKSVNTRSGEILEFPEFDVRDTYFWAFPPTRYLILSDTQADDTTPTTYRVVDPVTGEEVDTLTNVVVSELEGHTGLGRVSLVFSADGNTEVIAFRAAETYLLRESGGEADIRQLPALPGLDVESTVTAELSISPDGSFLAATIEGGGEGDRFLIDLTDPDAMWTVYPSQAGTDPDSIFFVPGTGS